MCHSTLGGSGRIGLELAAELSRRGHRVHLFSRTAPSTGGSRPHHVVLHRLLPEAAAAPSGGHLPVEWPERETQALLGQLLRVTETEGLDLLHFHYALPFAFIAGELKEALGARAPVTVGTLHGTDVSTYGRDPVVGPKLAGALAAADCLTTVSRSQAALAGETLRLRELPRVIPNFVDLACFRPRGGHSSPDRSPGSGGRTRARIAHVSNFRAVKNPAGLARIFTGIREKLDAELWLVGDGPELGRLRSYFSRQGLARDVLFWGPQRQVGPILARADLLLMPSLAESFCLAALESMACGVPVLASRVGGLPEVVAHGETGLLFPVAEPEAAVAMAVGLLSDPGRHAAMRRAAVNRARGFGHRRVVAAYEGLYESLWPRREPRPRPAGGGPFRGFCRQSGAFLHSLPFWG